MPVTVPHLLAWLLSGAASTLAVAQTPVLTLMNPNINNRPGNWLQAISHGVHSVSGLQGAPPVMATACGANTTRFIPIHASLIPKGLYQGCVLVWENGGQQECFPTPLVNGDIDVRWAIIDPHTEPATVHKFAWRFPTAFAPAPLCAPNAPPGYQGLFCGGHCWLPDGRLLVAGGDYWATGACPAAGSPPTTPDFVGSRIILIFDPDNVDVNQPFQQGNGPGFGKPWQSLHTPTSQVDLHYPRWYPTCTLVAPADMLTSPFAYIAVAGGVETYNHNLSTIVPPGDRAFNTMEVLQWDLSTGAITHDARPGHSPSWLYPGPASPLAGGMSFFYYPRMFALSARANNPDGLLWMAAMTAQSASADVVGSTQPVNWVDRNTIPLSPGKTLIEEPMSVLFPAVLPSYRDSILVMGGAQIAGTLASHGQGTATSECWMVDTRASSLSWVPFFPMNHARKFASAVLLPDAAVLVVGGGANVEHGGAGLEQLVPEMFYGGQWLTLSNQATARTYHSIALLLDDGRVLSAGGNTCDAGAEYEIFEPPYLQAGDRPVFVNDPPAVIRYNELFNFELALPFGQRWDSIVLMRPATTTHGQDSGQRYERLAEESPPETYAVGATYVRAPANPTVVPPGYCMLFVISNGVPSVARWVQLLP